MQIVYDYPLYRPPSEANSVIFQVTIGCSYNKCSFCNMYRTKKYVERQLDELKSEIDLVSVEQPWTRRIFLADGDALNLQTTVLLQILEYLYLKFNYLERVSCYAMPRNILEKKDTELQTLREAGLSMLYVGIESGNDLVLRKITKGASQRQIIHSCRKAKDNGFNLSCMIILGIGGRTYSTQHIIDTVKTVNEISPDYLAALTLNLEQGIYDEFMFKYSKQFEPLNDLELLKELHILINGINSKYPITFRANHASNVYSIGGTLPDDRENLLSLIHELTLNPGRLRDKRLRRF
ncbi:MAG TPA: radical SAM protein [Nitrososphaeraceae archaeon]